MKSAFLRSIVPDKSTIIQYKSSFFTKTQIRSQSKVLNGYLIQHRGEGGGQYGITHHQSSVTKVKIVIL